jgi:hypothetical protein
MELAQTSNGLLQLQAIISLYIASFVLFDQPFTLRLWQQGICLWIIAIYHGGTR